MRRCGALNTSLPVRGRRDKKAQLRDALNDCDLVDLGFVGLPFTYDNGKEGMANVKVRLDRAVADTN